MGVWSRKLLAGFVALGLALSASPAAIAESLADALIAAYRNSNLLEQNRAVLRAADEDLAQAVASLRPTLTFVTRFDFRPGTAQELQATVQLTGDVTLYDFGRGQLGVDASREMIMATREALRGVEQRVLLSAVAAFMDVRSMSETVSLRQSNLRLIERELQAARDRFEVGEITRTDVAIAEARLAAARSNLAAAEGDLAVAREAYNAVTGRYPGALAAPPRLPQTAANLDAAREVARRSHPAIRQAQREVTVSELNVERAAAARSGSITAGASAGVGADSTGTSSAVGMNLTYSRPIYQGGALSSLHRQAMARRDGTRAALHQTVADVLQEVGRAWSDVTVANARIEASERQAAAARTAFEGVSEEAELGARTTLDVLNAEQELLDAQAARIMAEAGRQVASYALLSAMGLLTVEHLNLGIPTYDPEAYYNAVRNAPVTSVQGERLDRVLRSIGRE